MDVKLKSWITLYNKATRDKDDPNKKKHYAVKDWAKKPLPPQDRLTSQQSNEIIAFLRKSANELTLSSNQNLR